MPQSFALIIVHLVFSTKTAHTSWMPQSAPLSMPTWPLSLATRDANAFALEAWPTMFISRSA
jgi:hypothetical protein